MCISSLEIINDEIITIATIACSTWSTVCLSVTLHLTSRMSVRPRNDTIYPTGDEGKKICGVFSENAPLQS